MNQQHSETEEEVKARIEKEADRDYERAVVEIYGRPLRITTVEHGVSCTNILTFTKTERVEIYWLMYQNKCAELTALREKTIEIAISAWQASYNYTVTTHGYPHLQEHLDALRSKINSSSNKG